MFCEMPGSCPMLTEGAIFYYSGGPRINFTVSYLTEWESRRLSSLTIMLTRLLGLKSGVMLHDALCSETGCIFESFGEF